jgi:polysaccharide deacetylase 2 family uncharacterized protein YibQ
MEPALSRPDGRARATAQPANRARLAWRLLAALWALVAVGALAGVGTLSWLGPPESVGGAPPAATAAGPAVHREAAGSAPSSAPAPAPPPAVSVPQRAAGSPIPPPDPAMLEPSAQSAAARLPRIGPDGRTPMQVYAAGVETPEQRPKIAVLVAGIGQSASGSDDALRSLPAAVSFAVSPYAGALEPLLADIRAKGHEFLVSLPMEPQGYPVNDEGSQALLISSPTDQNARRLDWALSRMAGYVGATNALDGMKGERFTASAGQLRPLLEQLAGRGLLFVDASPETDQVPFASVRNLVARRVDIVLDMPAVRSEIDWKLAQLEELARDRGAALGLALLPRPVTVSVLGQWASGLRSRGFALVPVSFIARLPAGPPTGQQTRTETQR